MHSSSPRFRRRLASLALALISVAASGQVKTRDRIVEAIDDENASPLQNNISPKARPEFDHGRVQDSLQLDRITIVFKPTRAQQDGLSALLLRQQDPGSVDYHKWLTPEQYAEQFGLSQNDFKKIAAWLERHGLRIVDAARGRTWIAFRGTAAQVASTLHTEIRRYVVNGESHYANATAPSLPASFAGLVLGIRSLDDFRLKPRAQVIRTLRPNLTSSISGSHLLAPADFSTIYDVQALYNSGIDGTGQKLAIVGQTDILLSDIDTFRSVSKLPRNEPQVILVPGSADPGVVSGDIGEADLDLEWAGAVARMATLIYVNSKSVFDSLQYAVDQNLAAVVSTSYGDCEQNFSNSEINVLTAIAQQANAQGQTIVAATGDSGAADCDFSSSTNPTVAATHGLAVDIPASLPFVTGAGGNEFNEGSGSFWSSTNDSSNGSALSYIPETSWNDTATTGSLSAGGGGASILFPKPTWQTGPGVPNDGARDVPDVSFNASPVHDGYLICSQGSCVSGYRALDNSLTVVGGTSAAAPVFAGIVTLINQKMGAAQGNVNPGLYSLAATGPDAFHDNLTGDNRVPCAPGSKDCATGSSFGYSAGVGYDRATGLGSVDAFNLVNDWAVSGPAIPDFRIAPAANPTLTIVRGSSGTVSLAVTALNGFSGSVALTCAVSTALSGTTCSVSPNTVTGDSTVVLTVTSPQSASLYPPASHLLPDWGVESSLLLAAGLTLMRGRPRRSGKALRRSGLAGLTLLILICLTALVACGGGGSTSKVLPGSSSQSIPVTGSVSVQAISGSLGHSTVIAVTVN